MKAKKQRRGGGKRTTRHAQHEVQQTPGTGPARFTTDRFFGGIGDPLAKDLLKLALASGYQIEVKQIHPQTLPAILILACYSRYYVDVELVDDYDRLVEEYRTQIADVAHPDKFLASCIGLLHSSDAYPSYEAFQDVRIPDLFKQLTNIEE